MQVWYKTLDDDGIPLIEATPMRRVDSWDELTGEDCFLVEGGFIHLGPCPRRRVVRYSFPASSPNPSPLASAQRPRRTSPETHRPGL